MIMVKDCATDFQIKQNPIANSLKRFDIMNQALIHISLLAMIICYPTAAISSVIPTYKYIARREEDYSSCKNPIGNRFLGIGSVNDKNLYEYFQVDSDSRDEEEFQSNYIRLNKLITSFESSPVNTDKVHKKRGCRIPEKLTYIDRELGNCCYDGMELKKIIYSVPGYLKETYTFGLGNLVYNSPKRLPFKGLIFCDLSTILKNDDDIESFFSHSLAQKIMRQHQRLAGAGSSLTLDMAIYSPHLPKGYAYPNEYRDLQLTLEQQFDLFSENAKFDPEKNEEYTRKNAYGNGYLTSATLCVNNFLNTHSSEYPTFFFTYFLITQMWDKSQIDSFSESMNRQGTAVGFIITPELRDAAEELANKIPGSWVEIIPENYKRWPDSFLDYPFSQKGLYKDYYNPEIYLKHGMKMNYKVEKTPYKDLKTLLNLQIEPQRQHSCYHVRVIVDWDPNERSVGDNGYMLFALRGRFRDIELSINYNYPPMLREKSYIPIALEFIEYGYRMETDTAELYFGAFLIQKSFIFGEENCRKSNEKYYIPIQDLNNDTIHYILIFPDPEIIPLVNIGYIGRKYIRFTAVVNYLPSDTLYVMYIKTNRTFSLYLIPNDGCEDGNVISLTFSLTMASGHEAPLKYSINHLTFRGGISPFSHKNSYGRTSFNKGKYLIRGSSSDPHFFLTWLTPYSSVYIYRKSGSEYLPLVIPGDSTWDAQIYYSHKDGIYYMPSASLLLSSGVPVLNFYSSTFKVSKEGDVYINEHTGQYLYFDYIDVHPLIDIWRTRYETRAGKFMIFRCRIRSGIGDYPIDLYMRYEYGTHINALIVDTQGMHYYNMMSPKTHYLVRSGINASKETLTYVFKMAILSKQPLSYHRLTFSAVYHSTELSNLLDIPSISEAVVRVFLTFREEGGDDLRPMISHRIYRDASSWKINAPIYIKLCGADLHVQRADSQELAFYFRVHTTGKIIHELSGLEIEQDLRYVPIEKCKVKAQMGEIPGYMMRLVYHPFFDKKTQSIKDAVLSVMAVYENRHHVEKNITISADSQEEYLLSEDQVLKLVEPKCDLDVRQQRHLPLVRLEKAVYVRVLGTCDKIVAYMVNGSSEIVLKEKTVVEIPPSCIEEQGLSLYFNVSGGAHSYTHLEAPKELGRLKLQLLDEHCTPLSRPWVFPIYVILQEKCKYLPTIKLRASYVKGGTFSVMLTRNKTLELPVNLTVTKIPDASVLSTYVLKDRSDLLFPASHLDGADRTYIMPNQVPFKIDNTSTVNFKMNDFPVYTETYNTTLTYYLSAQTEVVAFGAVNITVLNKVDGLTKLNYFLAVQNQLSKANFITITSYVADDDTKLVYEILKNPTRGTLFVCSDEDCLETKTHHRVPYKLFTSSIRTDEAGGRTLTPLIFYLSNRYVWGLGADGFDLCISDEGHPQFAKVCNHIYIDIDHVNQPPVLRGTLLDESYYNVLNVSYPGISKLVLDLVDSDSALNTLRIKVSLEEVNEGPSWRLYQCFDADCNSKEYLFDQRHELHRKVEVATAVEHSGKNCTTVLNAVARFQEDTGNCYARFVLAFEISEEQRIPSLAVLGIYPCDELDRDDEYVNVSIRSMLRNKPPVLTVPQLIDLSQNSALPTPGTQGIIISLLNGQKLPVISDPGCEKCCVESLDVFVVGYRDERLVVPEYAFGCKRIERLISIHILGPMVSSSPETNQEDVEYYNLNDPDTFLDHVRCEGSLDDLNEWISEFKINITNGTNTLIGYRLSDLGCTSDFENDERYIVSASTRLSRVIINSVIPPAAQSTMKVALGVSIAAALIVIILALMFIPKMIRKRTMQLIGGIQKSIIFNISHLYKPNMKMQESSIYKSKRAREL